MIHTTITTEIRITAPKGKPVVEFWDSTRTRKYPEETWKFGGASLLEHSPSLIVAGFSAAHLVDIGKVYQVKCEVAWSISPKDPKWHDIVAVKIV